MAIQKPYSQIAGENVKRLIKESRYRTQEGFAYAFGAELRTVNRWLNIGIKQIDTLQEIADFFSVEIPTLLQNNEKGE